MPVAVPALNRFYPAVPLKELTSLYSVGGHAFPENPAGQTHRVAILSYLPRTLMIYDNFVYNNKYILFVEALAQVTSITWSVQLYLNGVEKPAGSFIATDNSNLFEYSISFSESVVDGAGIPLFDRMVVTCKVVNGAQTRTMQLEHSFAKATNVTGLVSATQSFSFAGEPHTYNFMANQLKEYFPDELLKWNQHNIETQAEHNQALRYIVLGVLYYNIMVSPAVSSPLLRNFNWQNFTRTEFVTAINNNTAYTGNFRVGPGMIPLHILNDAMPDINNVPDFANIPDNNPIYQILSSDVPLRFDWLDPAPPGPFVISQSKARLLGDRTRLTALFQYAMFPKSAIKLVAILVKFLLEASRKNNFAECKDRTDKFPEVNLGNHKKTLDVARNILTHYFRDPYNIIEEFAPEALRVADLSVSPYTYSLVHNVAPRILKAYFARRVAKKISDDFYELSFERTDNLQFRNAAGNWVFENGTQRPDPNGNPSIAKPTWDNFLGRETFVVVETWNCTGRLVQCNLGLTPNPFAVGVNNNNLQVELDGNFVYNIEKDFGDYTALHTAANALPGDDAAMVTEYLDVNHGNKSIARIRLRPDSLANFEAWTNSLANNTISLSIKTRLTDNTPCIFGNNTRQAVPSGTFLDASDPYNNQLRYNVVNRVVYETHHEDDIFNRLMPAGRRIGKVPNPWVRDIANNNAAMLPSRKVVYTYIDQLGHEHFICDVQLHKPRKRRNGARLYRRTDISPTPAVVDNFLANYPQQGNRFYRLHPNTWVLIDTTAAPPVQPMEDVANNLGESRWKYYGSHDNTTTFTADRRDEYDQIIVRGVNNNAIVSFELDDDDPLELRVEIVRMPDEVDYDFTVAGVAKTIRYTFSNTHRRFAHPGCFAAFLGILGHLNYNDMVTTGMCFEDATSYPSVSHPNGDSIDTAHRNTHAQRVATVAQFIDWGFTQVISGDQPQYLNDGAHQHQADHNNHLHSGNFDAANNITDIIQ